MKILGLIAVGFGVAGLAGGAHAQTPAGFTYQSLQFEGNSSFFTGIHANIITGNYVIPGTSYTGGLLYDTTSQSWSPFPYATANNSNYPGAFVSSPYGPSFGSQYGILQAVGSYQSTSSAPYDVGYLYDAAAAPGQTLTTLYYPSTGGATTLYTIGHSIFGNQMVGNYDTDLATGNAFIYDIKTGTYVTNNKPNAISTTAYGIWGDKISGGYFDVSAPSVEHGYIYDRATGTFTQYDHPGAVSTHFEGIVGAGRAGEYNLVTNWTAVDGTAHASVMHLAADGTVTWYEITIPADIVSSNSAYGDTVVGIYVDDAVYAYIATIPGMYNPIRNDTPLLVSAAGATGILANPGGDDVVNNSSILVSGANSVGIKADTYGVVTNSGSVTVTGAGSTGIQMNGRFSTLVNTGTIVAVPGSDAVATGLVASGTTVVNNGTIDGRVNISGDPDARFENNGWLGVTAAGPAVTHRMSGVFAQTPDGVLALRLGATSGDSLQVDGVARLNGTLATAFANPATLQTSYTVLTATQGATGTFSAVATEGLPAFISASLSYAPTSVSLNLASGLALLPALTSNQRMVGAAIDRVINTPTTTTTTTGGSSGGGSTTTATTSLTSLPSGLSPFYSLSPAQIPGALSALSGEAYASEQSVIIGDGIYSREAVLGRLRQSAYSGQTGPLAALGYGGPALSYAGPAAAPADTASAALAYATKAPAAPPAPAVSGITVWAQGFGGWTSLDGNGNASGVDETIGGIISGADIAVGDWRIGAALGYSQSNASISNLASSTDVNSMLVALYAGTAAGPFNVRLGATYAFNQIDASRTIAFPGFLEQASAQYDGGTAQVFAEVGYGFAVQALALEPFAGLAWVHLDTDGFTETGAASSGLTGSSSSADVGYGSLGLRAATTLALPGGMVLTPHVSAAWQYAFGDLDPAAQLAFTALPGSNFSVAGVPLAENTALVEAGLDLHLTSQARIGVSYVGQLADSATVNAFQANFTWRF